MDDIEATLRKLLQEHLEAITKVVEDTIRRELAATAKPLPACVYFDNEGNPWREATASDVGQEARFGDHGFNHAMLPPYFEGVIKHSCFLADYPFQRCNADGEDLMFRHAYVRIPRVGKASQ